MLIEVGGGGHVSNYSIEEESFKNLRDVIEVGDRPIVGRSCFVKSILFDEWSDFSAFEGGGKTAFLK